jgi:regulator of sirC expression with transglutaminase-like and TPR domain
MSALAQALTTDDAPVELVALLVAAELMPTLDVELELRRLDALAEALRIERAARSSADEAALLVEGIGGSLGFRGDREDYYSPSNSLLPRVLERRAGLPLTLAVIYVAIARRLGIEARGVGFPGHFLVRIGRGEEAAFIDPFEPRVASMRDMEAILERVRGHAAPVMPEHLRAATPRELAVRMLTNLDVAFRKQGNLGHAFVACDRRVELTGLPEHQRERGLLALRLGSDSIAVSDLHDYLAARPGAQDRASIRAAAELAAKRMMSAGPRN